MSTRHSTTGGAVITRLHDYAARTETSGTATVSLFERSHEPGGGRGRGCGTGRAPHPLLGTPVDVAPVPRGGNEADRSVAYGEGTGDTGERARANEAEFTAYVQQRRASLYATAYHLTGDRFEAEDLLQSALFSTYRAWDRITDKAAVGGYLRRTMTNLHISAWRRRKLNEYPTEELPETATDTDAMRGTELRTVLWQALTRLPELQRTMLVLRYYEGRTDPEIAKILDISVGTVKSSIWRSLRRLRDDEALSRDRDREESFGELVA
ncbi:SigE family RNA polymerase sigma factor [Streptomyces sp. SID11385]|uniref:SigE family RNA polymerase sigma factor n=1 Tax=Streptomyces sp. SID11385 TaxID=2706031 RepID=UPI0013C8F571|nr:SigE family RNA polymerase sigma factor [Streptomyces sp. SID11385]NEA43938.1 SigE family RNA polymerase sigma factor [Streptomyces sp. SID11385]